MKGFQNGSQNRFRRSFQDRLQNGFRSGSRDDLQNGCPNDPQGGEQHGSPMTGNRMKGIIITACIVLIFLFVILKVCLPMLELVRTPEEFKSYIAEKGTAGTLSFFFIMILQTITLVIPAGPFEIAAGTAFGVLWGTLICDAAVTGGNMAAFLLSKKFGIRYVSMFVSEEKIKKFSIRKMTPRRKWLVCLIFLIPGLPKDQATYLLGLTDLRACEFLLICSLFRLPTILVQVMSGDALFRGKTAVSIILILASLVLSGAGAWGYAKYENNRKKVQKDKER